MSDAPSHLSRREFVVHGTGALASATVAGRLVKRRWWSPARGLSPTPSSSQAEALRVLGRSTLQMPGALPDAALPMGADTMPQIEHVVVLMLENHSYDNFFGMLGRGLGERPRGDGFTLAADGLPDATNPYPDGRRQRAFRMPTTCQFHATPSQEWYASHEAYNNGAMDGFVRTPISIGASMLVGPVAMGYWTADDLPFTYSLASAFPIADRWFSSCLAQTDPQRRYLIAATSSGMTDDLGNPAGDAAFGTPAAAGTIFNRFTEAGITWADYAYSTPTGATLNLFPQNDGVYQKTNVKPYEQFFADAKAGKLPQFSLLDPDFGNDSQENPQNITRGEGVLAQVVDALGNSPKWRQTLFILTYDEHGGYYDHVPPPVALAPDAIPPVVLAGESEYDGFARYGMRVPSVVVGPYVKRNHVSHLVYDHTSILAFVERKWNLRSLTLRDANANDLTDFLDLDAMRAGRPTFPELPSLAPAGDDAARLACSKSGPGTIPAPLPPTRVVIRSVRASRSPRGIVVELQTDPGTISGLDVTLARGHRRLAEADTGQVIATAPYRVFLPLAGRGRPRGTFTVTVTHLRRTVARRTVRL